MFIITFIYIIYFILFYFFIIYFNLLNKISIITYKKYINININSFHLFLNKFYYNYYNYNLNIYLIKM